MKKKIKDLTLGECEIICQRYITNCDSCPLSLKDYCRMWYPKFYGKTIELELEEKINESNND